MKSYLLIVLSMLLLLVTSCDDTSFNSEVTPMELAGVNNFYQVSSTLYRSGRPDSVGLVNIEQMGIRTVVDLRRFSRDKWEHTSLEQIRIPMMIWPLDEDEVIRYIRTVSSPEKQPGLVHCLRGSDRTGAMVALYRVVVQDWSKEKAIREMTTGGFGYQWWLFSLKQWIEDLDVESIRNGAGLVKSSGGEYVQER